MKAELFLELFKDEFKDAAIQLDILKNMSPLLTEKDIATDSNQYDPKSYAAQILKDHAEVLEKDKSHFVRVFLLIWADDFDLSIQLLNTMIRRTSDLKKKANLTLVLADVYSAKGDHLAAVREVSTALKDLEDEKGSDKYDEAMSFLGSELGCVARHEEAIVVGRMFVCRDDSTFVGRFRLMSYIFNNLAMSLYKLAEKVSDPSKKAGFYEDGVYVLVRLLGFAKKHNYPNPYRKQIFHTLSLFYYSMGDFPAALKVLSAIASSPDAEEYVLLHFNRYLVQLALLKQRQDSGFSLDELKKKILSLCVGSGVEVRRIYENLPNNLYPSVVNCENAIRWQVNESDRRCAAIVKEMEKIGQGCKKVDIKTGQVKKLYSRKAKFTVAKDGEKNATYIISCWCDDSLKKMIIYHHVKYDDFLFQTPEEYFYMLQDYAKAVESCIQAAKKIAPNATIVHTGSSIGGAMAEISAWEFDHKYTTFDSTGSFNVIRKISKRNGKSPISHGITYFSKVGWDTTRYRPFGNACLLSPGVNLLSVKARSVVGNFVKQWPLQPHPFLFVLPQEVSLHKPETVNAIVRKPVGFEEYPREILKHFTLDEETFIINDFEFSDKNLGYLKYIFNNPKTLITCVKFYNCVLYGGELKECVKKDSVKDVCIESWRKSSSPTVKVFRTLSTPNGDGRLLTLRFLGMKLEPSVAEAVNDLVADGRIQECFFPEGIVSETVSKYVSIFSHENSTSLVSYGKVQFGVIFEQDVAQLYYECRTETGDVQRGKYVFAYRREELNIILNISRKYIDQKTAAVTFKAEMNPYLFSLTNTEAQHFFGLLSEYPAGLIEELNTQVSTGQYFGAGKNNINDFFSALQQRVRVLFPSTIINKTVLFEVSQTLQTTPIVSPRDEYTTTESLRRDAMYAPNVTQLPIGREKLQSLRKIFEDVLKRQIEAEVKYLWDIQEGRASYRDDFSSKLANVLSFVATTAVSAAAPVAAPVVAAVSWGATQINESRQKYAVTEGGKSLDKLDYALFGTCISQMASDAWLCFEPMIAMQLSENPDNEVLTLAKVVGRRVVDYLKEVAQKGQALPSTADLTSCLFTGIREGDSGRWHEGILNNRLEGRNKEKFTVEGLCARSAVREYGPGDDVATNSVYQVGDVNADKEGNPKYLILLPKGSRATLAAEKKVVSKELPAAKNDPKHHYYPSVYLASATDMMEYENQLKRSSAKLSFNDYIKQKISKEWRDRGISEVWVRDADLQKGLTLKGDYSGVDFSGTNFAGAIFDGAVFARTKMVFSNLSNVTCVNGVNLNESNLSYANLSDAKLEKGTSRVKVTWLGANINQLEKLPDPEIEAIRREMAEQEAIQKEQQRIFYNYIDDITKRLEGKINVLEEIVSKLPKEMADQVRAQLGTLAMGYEELKLDVEGLQKLYKETNDSGMQAQIAELTRKSQEMERALQEWEKKASQFSKGLIAIGAKDSTIPVDSNPDITAKASIIEFEGAVSESLKDFAFKLVERFQDLPVVAIGIDHVNLPPGYKGKIQAISRAVGVTSLQADVVSAGHVDAISRARAAYNSGKAVYRKGDNAKAMQFFADAKDLYKTDVLGSDKVPINYKREADKRLLKMKGPEGKYSSAKLSK